MKRILLALLALVVQGGGLAAGTPEPRGIDDLVARALKEFQAPGLAVAVVQDGKCVHLKGYGTRKFGKDSPVTPDTLFAIASCSKAFTASTCGLLIDEGKMAWDDPVRKHLPSFRLRDPSADRDVTIRDLLCHRTGMPEHDWLWTGVDFTVPDLVRRYGLARPSSSFRSKWEYANMPFMAVSLAVGRTAKTPWPDLVKKRLFEPLGMRSATCSAKEAVASADVASPHVPGPKDEPLLDEWEPWDPEDGSGAICASARDMVRWVLFQLGKGELDGKLLLKEATFKEMQTPQVVVRPYGQFLVYFPAEVTDHLSYGLGWFVQDYRGHHVVSHGGSLFGFRAQVMLVPRSRCAVVVLVNRGRTFGSEAVAKTILDGLLGLTPRDWVGYHRKAGQDRRDQERKEQEARAARRKLGTKPSHPLADYAGVYEEPAYGKVEVRVRGKELELSWEGRTFRLEHFHFDTFTATISAPESLKKRVPNFADDATFCTDRRGVVAELTFLEQRFRRERKEE